MSDALLPEIFRKASPKRCRRAAIYVRVSDTTGREDTLISDEIQIMRCTEYAQREGIEIVKVVTDLNLSGETSKKRQIAKMIDEVRQGLYDTIIVWKWSRWGRNLQDSMINMALLEEVGGYLVAATEPIEVTTPAGVFARTQFLAMAQLQLDQIREGWREAHRNRLGKGLPHTGARVFGYIYDPEARTPETKYSPHPIQFPALVEMYDMYLKGKSHRGIARWLNDGGILTNGGKLWNPTMVRQVMDQGFGAGRITYNTKAKGARPAMEFQMISDKWPHAITKEQWDDYLSRRKDASDRLPPRTAAQKTMLKGLVYCADCDRRFSLSRARQVKKGREYNYSTWRCSGSTDLSCKGSMVRDAVVLAHVRRWVAGLADGMDEMPELVARNLRTKRALGAVESIDKQIAYVKAQLKRGVALVVDEVLTEEDFKDQKADYKKQLKDLEEARVAHQREASVNAVPPKDAFQALLDAIDAQMDPDGLNTGLKIAIHKIMVSKGPKGSDRIHIIPRWEAPEPTTQAV